MFASGIATDVETDFNCWLGFVTNPLCIVLSVYSGTRPRTVTAISVIIYRFWTYD